MRRLRTLSRRQAVLLAAAAILCAAVAATALTGHLGAALTILALFFAALLGLLLLIVRRLAALQAANRKAQADLRAVVDQTQRRVLSAVEQMLLHAGDRHHEVTTTLDGIRRDTRADVEALIQLYQGFTPRAPMPASDDPAAILGLLHLIRTRTPRLVLLAGGGAAALWLGYALEQTGGKLIALTGQDLVAAHGLTEVVTVREADPGSAADLFDAVGDVHGVDLLIADDPHAALLGQLADRATVLVGGAGTALRQALATVDGLSWEGEALGGYAVLNYQRTVRELAAG